jgi:hypothetical protein
MTTNFSAPHLVPDDENEELTRARRALYAAPDSAGYWTALEQRIMDRVANGEPLDAWWSVPAQWARIAVIAAGFALIVAGSLFLRSQAEQSEMAYESVVDPGPGGPTLAIREAPTTKQATINYIDGR